MGVFFTTIESGFEPTIGLYWVEFSAGQIPVQNIHIWEDFYGRLVTTRDQGFEHTIGLNWGEFSVDIFFGKMLVFGRL